MSYINFCIITETPGQMAQALSARGYVEQQDDGDGGQQWVPTRKGLEWHKVSNPIITGFDGTDPDTGDPVPVFDTRPFFLCKFAWDAKDDQYEGEDEYDAEGNRRDLFLATKFGKWIKNNGAWQNAPAGYQLRDGTPVTRAWKITGQKIWLIVDDLDKYPRWL